MFDILATDEFLKRLAKREGKFEVGIVGMRMNIRTHSAELLGRYVSDLGIPVLGFLRETQNYVHLAAQGSTLWDVSPSKVEKDLDQWNSMLAWLGR